jgi:hypothetical protein
LCQSASICRRISSDTPGTVKLRTRRVSARRPCSSRSTQLTCFTGSKGTQFTCFTGANAGLCEATLLLLHLRQCVPFCTSKASKLSTSALVPARQVK